MAAKKPPNNLLRAQGNAARARAQERSRGGRITVDAWYPELQAFQDKGWKIAWIAYAVQLSERRVSEILAEARDRRRKLLELPVLPDDLTAKDRDCLEFTPAGFKLFFERFSGRPLLRHCEKWIEYFVDHRNLLINVPPRHAKSAIFSVWVPIWLLCINRNEQILVISKSRDLAIKFCREVEFHLSTNEDLIKAYGRFAPDQIGDTPWRPGMGELLIQGRDRDTKSGDLSLQSRGMEQQVLGMEATVVVCDDITDYSVAMSVTSHQREVDKFHGEIMSRIEPASVGGASGRAVVIGQRVAALDIYGELAQEVWPSGPQKDEPLWHVEVQPAILDWETHETLWPEKWSWDELQLIYARVGAQRFYTMYQQQPAMEGTNLALPEWLERCQDKDRDGYVGMRTAQESSLLPISRVVSIDPSPTEWNAMIVADVLYAPGSGQWGMWIVAIERWKGGSQAFREHVNHAIDAYEPEHLIVEESSFFKWFSNEPWYEMLARRVNLIKHHTGVNKNDLDLGVDSLGADFEQGNIRLPYGDKLGRDMSLLLEREALSWPNTRTFDTLMSAWFIKWNRKRLRPKIALPESFDGTTVKPNRLWQRELDRKNREARSTRIDQLAR